MSIPIFVPHRGCPHDCVFCNQRHITGITEAVFDERQIHEEIKAYLKGSKDKEIEIAFFGGSFTAIDWPLQKAYLELGKSYVDKGLVKGIRCSTRPDAINDTIMERLADYPITAIELGVQSLDETVLQRSRRGHSVSDVAVACGKIHEANIELGLQMMLGLPGDSLEKSIETLKAVIALKPATLRIYPTLVFKDTMLYDLYQQGSYTPLTLDEAIMWCKVLIKELATTDIRLIRLGLHLSKSLKDEGNIVAGPLHPAFGQLVFDGMVVDEILEIHKKQAISSIEAGPKMYQRLIGYGRQGVKRLNAQGIHTLIFNSTLQNEVYNVTFL